MGEIKALITTSINANKLIFQFFFFFHFSFQNSAVGDFYVRGLNQSKLSDK